MTHPTLILVALAALCAAPSADASIYRASDAAFACERRSDIERIFELAQTTPESAPDTMRVLHRTGACVLIHEGTYVTLREVSGAYIQIKVSADPRPLWALRIAIDWSAE